MEPRCLSRSGTRSLRLLARKSSHRGAPVAPFPPTRIRMSSSCPGAQRRRLYDGLLLDAGGTLLQLARPVEATYASIGRKYGLVMSESEIKQGFRRAFAAPWPQKLRYEGDGRPFWRLIVSEATGCADNGYFEEVYELLVASTLHMVMHGGYQQVLMKHCMSSKMLELSWQLSRILILA